MMKCKVCAKEIPLSPSGMCQECLEKEKEKRKLIQETDIKQIEQKDKIVPHIAEPAHTEKPPDESEKEKHVEDWLQERELAQRSGQEKAVEYVKEHPSILVSVGKVVFIVSAIIAVFVIGLNTYQFATLRITKMEINALIDSGEYSKALLASEEFLAERKDPEILDLYELSHSLIESKANFEQGEDAYANELWERAESFYEKVIQQDIHFGEAQRKLVIIREKLAE